jgi:anti-sigma regulatory factor (Ser/Thr protein kinase)
MTVSNQVSALRVADEEFLIASTIERCPKTMMIRELFMNAIEAATKQVIGEQIIDIKVKTLNGVPKLSIINTGPGMSDAELYHMCDIAASIGKEMGLDENFGMGAKVASLPSNKFGLRYRSSKEGVVSEVILCQRDGIYGRLRRENGDEVIDVTESCKDDGYPAGEWTEIPECPANGLQTIYTIGSTVCRLASLSNSIRERINWEMGQEILRQFRKELIGSVARRAFQLKGG